MHHRGIPDFEKASNDARLVVLDDLLKLGLLERLDDIFIKGSHQRNLNLLLITQNMFHAEHVPPWTLQQGHID
jgi:hypothetical protein